VNYRFKDRRSAGQLLADAVARRVEGQRVRIFALPRGGVAIGFEIARKLEVPLEIFLVRKLGVPGHEEFAMGAISSGGGLYLSGRTIDELKIPGGEIDRVIARETRELERRELAYHQPASLEVGGEVVVLVDDGLATGASMRSAARAVRKKEPRRLLIAVPVASVRSCEEMADEADEIICLCTPVDFHAVGEWYDDFRQVTDEEVLAMLGEARKCHPAGR